MPINVPHHPGEQPAANAPAELWTRYVNLLSLHQNAIIANQRSANEAACAAAQADLAAAQRAATAAFLAPPPPPRPPTRRQMVLDHFMGMPQVTGITDLQAVDISTAAVDAFLRRFPESP
jgi:soluble lytic murein transglycosylase-like protein